MQKSIYLNKGWKLKWTSFRQVRDVEKFLSGSTENWIDAQIPGDVHKDILNAGEGVDFYYGLNADLWRWVEDKDFWYRNDIELPEIGKDETAYLIFEGIDTFSTIYINGKQVWCNKNMFLPVEIDITEYCRKKKRINLCVKISSPVLSVDLNKDRDINDWNIPRLFARKAQFNYGWDIAPRLISCGIWKDVKIEIYKKARIKDLWVKTKDIKNDQATLEIEIEIEYFKELKKGEIEIEIYDGEEKIEVISKSISSKDKKLKIPLRIKNPKLWWPNGLGEQNLYLCKAILKEKGEIIDEKEGNFGIKKVELIQEKIKEKEYSFYFKINGKKIFIKGFNWTPLDALPGVIEKERYEKVLKLVKEANVNMLRVWGGGIYEKEIFYELCDRYGIMIWQDFMFACGRYPEYKEFLKEVEREAEFVIKSLRKHTCISLWSGGNENDTFRYWEEGKSYIKHKLSRKVLKNVWKKLNPEIPFIPDSPFSPSGDDPNSDIEGDCHLWAHGKSYKDDFYIKKRPRFISEIGHISVPDKEILLKFIPEEKLWPVFNEYWYYHSSDTLRYGWKYRIRSLFDSIKANNLPEPKNIDELIEATQTLQADAYVFWTEYYYNQPYCNGILLWNVCDCWPQISDSIISYDLKPKKVYYRIKEVFGKLKSIRE